MTSAPFMTVAPGVSHLQAPMGYLQTENAQDADVFSSLQKYPWVRPQSEVRSASVSRRNFLRRNLQIPSKEFVGHAA